MKAGERLGGRFEIIGELGRGGMATVYLATDLMRRERVALKVLHEHLMSDATATSRLRREINAAARIRHPQALVAHEIHELGGRLCLAMPVHSGAMLSSVLPSGEPLSEDAIKRIALDLAGALGAAHARGIIHRDVTPNNVMIDDEGRATLMDFGLARMQDHATQTATATAAGTWGYAAPETFDGPTPDPRSDLYSLGAVLYFAATGAAPFDSKTPAGVLRKQLTGTFPSLKELRPDLSDSLVETIEALLSRQPEHRPMGARALEEALKAGVTAAPDAAEAAAPKPAPAPSSAHPPPTLGIATPVLHKLPAGDCTVLVMKDHRSRRVRRLSRRKGPIRAYEKAAPERALADGVARRFGLPLDTDALPASMRERNFRLVERVSADVAEELRGMAVDCGFEARIFTGDPQQARPTGPILKAYVGFILGILGMVFLIMSGATAAGVMGGTLAAMIVMMIATVRRLKVGGAIFPRVWRAPATEAAQQISNGQTHSLQEAASTPASESAPIPQALVAEEDPLAQMHRRTVEQLASLEAAITAASDDLADTVLSRVRGALAELSAQTQRLREASLALTRERARAEDPAAAATVARIRQRLTRLETLEMAGDVIDTRERDRLRSAVASHEAELTARDEAEANLTLISARLLEIGGTAAQATRELRGDGDLRHSVGDLLKTLSTEAQLAASAAQEVSPPADAQAELHGRRLRAARETLERV